MNNEAKSEPYLPDRCKFLSEMTGFTVRAYKSKGVSYFVFSRDGRDVKTAYTYPKAKMYAEGYRAGIQHGRYS